MTCSHESWIMCEICEPEKMSEIIRAGKHVLISEFVKAKKDYYCGGIPEMTDIEFDHFERSCKALHPDMDELWSSVGYDEEICEKYLSMYSKKS